MIKNNQINAVIFKQTANNTASFVMPPLPSATTNLLVSFNNVTSSIVTPGYLAIQTGVNGVFDTSGYISSAKYSFYNSNAWGNQAVSNGLALTADYNTSGFSYCGNVYIMNLNSSSRPMAEGGAALSGPVSNPQSTVILSGLSPTTMANQIQILIFGGANIVTGTFTVYSLL